MLLPEHLAKHWVGQAVVSRVVEKRSLICFAKNQDLIYSVIHWPHQLLGGSIAVLNMLTEKTELRDKLENNTKYFRKKMTEAGFDIKPEIIPIVPIMLYDAVLAQTMAAKLLEEEFMLLVSFSRWLQRTGKNKSTVKRCT
jgi:7-keto-8-aminopelargonate synthetase-like enzyme